MRPLFKLPFLLISSACGGQTPPPAEHDTGLVELRAGDEAVDPDPQEKQKSAAQEELERITEEIKADVEKLRGERFISPVKVAISDAEEFRTYVKQRIDATETPEELTADEESSKLLGLLPPDFDYLQKTIDLVESQVGGFYDPGTRTFYLMEGFEGGIASVILSHELTHALDDQLFGLDDELETLGDNTDAEWAYWAVVEGSGTAVMERWTMEHLKSLDLSEMAELSSMGMDELKEAPTYLWKPLIGAYMGGSSFLAARPGELELSDAIRRAFEAPPRSSEQVLHPDKYWDPEQSDEPKPVRFEHADLPAGWQVRGEDTLGELLIGLFVEPVKSRGGISNPFEMAAPRLTREASEGWGGDRWLLLGRGDADRVLALATVWDSEEDAQQFSAAVLELRPHILAGTAQELAVTTEESRVHVVLARGAGRELADAARGWARFE